MGAGSGLFSPHLTTIKMKNNLPNITFIGAGTIGTALGNILAENGTGNILLHSVEPKVVDDINSTHVNTKYFPTLHLHPSLVATTDDSRLTSSGIIFLGIPSTILIGYLKGIRKHIPEDALLVNLAKGFGAENKTIIECLVEEFPNPVCTLKGPSFAREIINRVPTGFTLGSRCTNARMHECTNAPGRHATTSPHADHRSQIADHRSQIADHRSQITDLFRGTNIHLDYSTDILGVEILSILKNIYAVVLGIVDAQFNSANLQFLVLTKAFREMRRVLLSSGGQEETLFRYCGYGDFGLTALNDLSRNRTLGLLIGKGFFTEHVSHELVLEGKTAVNVFYRELSKKLTVEEQFPIIAELWRIFNGPYDVSAFVEKILNLPEPE
jgi:glycerol-3-phosphate dehydrogenase (NAD(P)+)